jgi:predicted dehydrogenase
MKKIRIGVVGAGLIGQVEHIPNLLHLGRHFQLMAVAEASPAMRKELVGRGLKALPSYRDLLVEPIDAVLIAAPDQFHPEITLAALAAGKHVFCEKPLSFSVAEAEEIAVARDRAKRVVQVGYMKRYDPAYEKLLSMLPEGGNGLRMISVQVQDPDSWPFNQHQGDFVKTSDLPRALIEEGRAKLDAQVRRATSRDLNKADIWGYTNSYCSSLIHDINAVHGMLEVMNLEVGDVVGAAFFADGDGGHGSVRLGGRALWQMTHLFVPEVGAYKERITLYFDDCVYELTFPSPYLNHFPTKLTVQRSNGNVLDTSELRVSYEEPFQRELLGFWASVVEGAPVRNTVEGAINDLKLVARLTVKALA